MGLPAKIWVCPKCDSRFVERWRLKRHLMLTHSIAESKAEKIAEKSEYWLRIKAEYVNPKEFDFEEEWGGERGKEEGNR